MKRIFAILLSAAVVSCSTAQPASAAEETAVFAGGCFWGVEAVFEHVKGVVDVRSGYAGGTKEQADYEKVSGGETRHAETVEIRFDPAKVSYEQLLSVFFTVVHDPTQLNRQGPDVGPQYRSAIFYNGPDQKAAADAFIAKLKASKAFAQPIVTEVVPLNSFFAAEDYHQDYMKKNPEDPYIVYHDVPKVRALKEKFRALYKG
jgi:peptide-methionine (S)-S-oxide reductase